MQRPTRICASTPSISSRTRRVLPIPASPRTVSAWQRLSRRAYRPEGVVLAEVGHAEDEDDAVGVEALDPAAVAPGCALRHIERAAEQGVECLGVERVRAGDVNGDDGDDATRARLLAGAGRRRRDLRRAQRVVLTQDSEL